MDRIVGFELSPVLWKKVITGLSAGRVQSVAVRLIVEREREIEEFVPTASYRVTAEFVGATLNGETTSFKAELSHRFATKEEALAFLNLCKDATFTLTSVTHKEAQHFSSISHNLNCFTGFNCYIFKWNINPVLAPVIILT